MLYNLLYVSQIHKMYWIELNEVFRVKIGAILETLRPVDNIIIHQLLKQEATKGWALITFFSMLV